MSADRSLELAHSWLQAALADISASEVLIREGYFTHVCFSCQQAAEKALKSYLLACGAGLIRTHVLPRLLRECRDLEPRLVELTDDCTLLTGYYTGTRYPDDPEDLAAYDADMAHEALLAARRVVACVQEAIAAIPGWQSSAGGEP